jgi:Xaa-Pro aminopeptidase
LQQAEYFYWSRQSIFIGISKNLEEIAMKYLPLETNLFIQNRQRFAAKLKPSSIAILNANDIMPTSADGSRSFIQNTDIFYLSGIDQEESILVIFPDAKEKKHREVLFVRETNEEIAVWEGPKYSKEEAKAVSGMFSGPGNLRKLSDLSFLRLNGFT